MIRTKEKTARQIAEEFIPRGGRAYGEIKFGEARFFTGLEADSYIKQMQAQLAQLIMNVRAENAKAASGWGGG